MQEGGRQKELKMFKEKKHPEVLRYGRKSALYRLQNKGLWRSAGRCPVSAL